MSFLFAALAILKRVPAWAWVLAAFAAVVLGAYWYGGHKQGLEDQAEIRQLRGELSQCAAVVKAQNDANSQAIKAARQAKQRAEDAEKRAGDYADKFARQLVSINNSLAEAKKDPACRQLLETRTCAKLF